MSASLTLIWVRIKESKHALAEKVGKVHLWFFYTKNGSFITTPTYNSTWRAVLTREAYSSFKGFHVANFGREVSSTAGRQTLGKYFDLGTWLVTKKEFSVGREHRHHKTEESEIDRPQSVKAFQDQMSFTRVPRK